MPLLLHVLLQNLKVSLMAESTVLMLIVLDCSWCKYGHENEMYKEPMNLKRGKCVYMRELRECGGRTEDKTKCAKG